MRRYISYFNYVFWHKYYVFCAASIVRELSLWLILIHDWSKFLPCEFIAYAHNFFDDDGGKRFIRDKTGAYDPNSQSVKFKYAWLSHQQNKHHWQSWISIGNGGKLEALEMPEKYIREMIADWIGAGMALSGRRDPRPWYETNKNDMVLHEKTRARIALILSQIKI